MKDLPPAYFTLVMATGIVSVAALDSGLPLLAYGMFGVNILADATLATLTIGRAARYPDIQAG